MLSNRVRNTLLLEYKGEARELMVTFDMIDRASSFVDWVSVPRRIQEGQIPVAPMTKFIWFCLNEAGHEPDIDEIYDEISESPENEKSYIALFMQLYTAFAPQGKKKTLKQAQKTQKKK